MAEAAKTVLRVQFKDSVGNTASRTYDISPLADTVTVADMSAHADLLATNFTNGIAAEITSAEIGVQFTGAGGVPLKTNKVDEQTSVNQYVEFDIYDNTDEENTRRVSIPGVDTSILERNPVTGRRSLMSTTNPATAGGLIQAFMLTAGWEWLNNADTPAAINTVDTGLMKTRESRQGGGVKKDG